MYNSGNFLKVMAYMPPEVQHTPPLEVEIMGIVLDIHTLALRNGFNSAILLFNVVLHGEIVIGDTLYDFKRAQRYLMSYQDSVLSGCNNCAHLDKDTMERTRMFQYINHGCDSFSSRFSGTKDLHEILSRIEDDYVHA